MDTLIDPTTGDYALDTSVSGALARDPAGGLANAVYLRLTTPLGSYWADPSLGSLLHTLNRAKAIVGIDVMAKGYALSALKPLLADGRAQSIDVQTVLVTADDGSERLSLLVSVVDASGQPHVFDHPVKVI